MLEERIFKSYLRFEGEDEHNMALNAFYGLDNLFLIKYKKDPGLRLEIKRNYEAKVKENQTLYYTYVYIRGKRKYDMKVFLGINKEKLQFGCSKHVYKPLTTRYKYYRKERIVDTHDTYLFNIKINEIEIFVTKGCKENLLLIYDSFIKGKFNNEIKHLKSKCKHITRQRIANLDDFFN